MTFLAEFWAKVGRGFLRGLLIGLGLAVLLYLITVAMIVIAMALLGVL